MEPSDDVEDLLEIKIETLWKLAGLHEKQKQMGAMLSYCKALTEMDEVDKEMRSKAHMKRGLVFLKMGDLHKAHKELTEAKTYDPNNKEADALVLRIAE